jgi:uncharacterized protein YfeS
VGKFAIIVVLRRTNGLLSVNDEEHLSKGEQNNSNGQQEGNETLHNVNGTIKKHSEIDL